MDGAGKTEGGGAAMPDSPRFCPTCQAALDLRIEAMTNKIGDRIDAFGSHTPPRT